MKTVSIVQQKGGAGKTTLAYLLASGAISKGLKVHCIDGDRNSQLIEWRRRCEEYNWEIERPIWSELLTMSTLSDDIDLLYGEMKKLEDSGTDLLILDTRPGTNEDTEDIAYAADVILVPTRAEAADYELAMETFKWLTQAADTFEDLEVMPHLALVLSDATKGVMTAMEPEGSLDGITRSEYFILEKLVTQPFLYSAIPASKICSQLPFLGPLPAALAAFEKDPGSHIRAKHVRKILSVAEDLVGEILKLEGIQYGQEAAS
jgi:chromosome partitioning protein